MAGQKEKLLQGIINEDWNLVVEYYTWFYNENPLQYMSESDNDIEDESDEESVVLTKLNVKSPNKSKKKIKKKVIVKDSNKQSVKKANKGKKKVQFLTARTVEDSNPRYQKAVKEDAKRIKETRKDKLRDEYMSNMVKCEDCGNEFDWNSEYPAGMLDKRHQKDLCNKCQRTGRK